MAGRIQTLKDKLGHLFPRTVAEAVIVDEDGTTLNVALKDIPSDHIKLSPRALEELDLPEGYTLTDFLVSYAQSNTSNVLAAAEVIPE